MLDYLALYRNYLTNEKHMSVNTISSYMRDLGQYQQCCSRRKPIFGGRRMPYCRNTSRDWSSWASRPLQ